MTRRLGRGENGPHHDKAREHYQTCVDAAKEGKFVDLAKKRIAQMSAE